MHLVVVESPTKAKTIGRFLGKEYVIKASMGHVMDLPKSKLGVDTDDSFAPQYELMPDKKKIISQLKSAAKTADSLILATDPDREGEAIASHVKDMLSSNEKLKIKNEKLQRIVFHEITKEAIEEALKHPRAINKNLVDAQTARRVLDRLVGYKLSPLLWQKVRRGLSAGRVQSVALRLIVEREREIEKFTKESYWTIAVMLKKETKGTEETKFELVEVNGNKIDVQQTLNLYDGEYKFSKTTIDKEEEAKKIVADLALHLFTVADVAQKEMRRSPQPPYTTSTLQQDGARRLGLSGKRTMQIAQKLYEEGYITYHRTDSVVMSKSAQFGIVNFIKKEFGDKYVPEKPRFYRTKQKLAQEAHEAIRPTNVGQVSSVRQAQDDPEFIEGSSIKYQVSSIAGEQGFRLYEMIWKRAVASQMSDAITESTIVLVNTEHKNGSSINTYQLKANGSILVFDGFLKINPFALQDRRLPDFKTGEKLPFVSVGDELHETQPPSRYNDASLIKTLEEKGIGRPSTYASIISTIEARAYIERGEGRFAPTSIGIAVNDFLVANFSDIDDIPFTATMEDELDNIAQGKREWAPMIKEFYKPFEKKLEEVKGAARVRIAVEELDEKCPSCGSPLVIRSGRFGKFISCSTFPACKFTKPLVEETNFTCPKCGGLSSEASAKGGKVIVKKTRKGRKFFGCSNYPACTFAAWRLEDIRNYDPNKPARHSGKRSASRIS